MCKSDDNLRWLKNENGMVNLSLAEHKEFLELIGEYNNSTDELMKLAIFLKIMAFLKAVFKNPKKAEYLEDKDITYADKIIRIIEKNACDITVSAVAATMFMNEDYINRIFKEETGMTIKSYLLIRKIAEAKRYLYLGKSVKEACLLSGFNDYANFLRTLKKYEGYSPGALDNLTAPL